MVIYKCFLCNFESNAKSVLKSKVTGKTYLCPECKTSHGCLVETETQKEFPSHYKLVIKKNEDVPIYYGRIMDRYDNKIVSVALQIFEAIDIRRGIFTYVITNVPGMYKTIAAPYRLLMAHDIAIIQTVGENILTTVKSRNPTSQTLLYDTKIIDDFSDNDKYKKIISQKDKNKISELETQNIQLLNNLYGLDIYKIIMFDLDYLLDSPLNFKKWYKLPKPLETRLKKKYETTQMITYNNLKDLNKLWHKYDNFYLGLPSLDNINLWLDKAWKSKAVCCGVVPFAPLSEWYKNCIIGKAQIKLLKQQKGIPFPLVEFNYRYIPTKRKSKITTAKSSLLTKTDIKLGQQMFNFAKKE